MTMSSSGKWDADEAAHCLGDRNAMDQLDKTLGATHRPGGVGQAEARIETRAPQGVPPNLFFNIQVRLDEAVANVIMYGAAGMIKWRLQSNWECGGPMVARIGDTGRPFDLPKLRRLLLAY